MRNQRAGRAEKHDAQTGVTQGAMAAAVIFFPACKGRICWSSACRRGVDERQRLDPRCRAESVHYASRIMCHVWTLAIAAAPGIFSRDNRLELAHSSL